MRIGILGTGVVGQILGTRLVQLGHDVKLGSRSATNE
ncbi:MAG: NAD(P)-binding domain-containing protein, partial [Gemmatimonas sp.]